MTCESGCACPWLLPIACKDGFCIGCTLVNGEFMLGRNTEKSIEVVRLVFCWSSGVEKTKLFLSFVGVTMTLCEADGGIFSSVDPRLFILDRGGCISARRYIYVVGIW